MSVRQFFLQLCQQRRETDFHFVALHCCFNVQSINANEVYAYVSDTLLEKHVCVQTNRCVNDYLYLIVSFILTYSKDITSIIMKLS